MKHFTQLTTVQRYHIQTLSQLNVAQQGIAVQVNVSPSTISREVRRNKAKPDADYQAEPAQTMAQQRNQRSAYKLDNELAQEVIERLKKHGSSEQISGVLQRQAGKKVISGTDHSARRHLSIYLPTKF